VPFSEAIDLSSDWLDCKIDDCICMEPFVRRYIELTARLDVLLLLGKPCSCFCFCLFMADVFSQVTATLVRGLDRPIWKNRAL